MDIFIEHDGTLRLLDVHMHSTKAALSTTSDKWTAIPVLSSANLEKFIETCYSELASYSGEVIPFPGGVECRGQLSSVLVSRLLRETYAPTS
jgi:hypothetical protein